MDSLMAHRLPVLWPHFVRLVSTAVMSCRDTRILAIADLRPREAPQD
jgi:hypothetical protein